MAFRGLRSLRKDVAKLATAISSTDRILSKQQLIQLASTTLPCHFGIQSLTFDIISSWYNKYLYDYTCTVTNGGRLFRAYLDGFSSNLSHREFTTASKGVDFDKPSTIVPMDHQLNTRLMTRVSDKLYGFLLYWLNSATKLTAILVSHGSRTDGAVWLWIEGTEFWQGSTMGAWTIKDPYQVCVIYLLF